MPKGYVELCYKVKKKKKLWGKYGFLCTLLWLEWDYWTFHKWKGFNSNSTCCIIKVVENRLIYYKIWRRLHWFFFEIQTLTDTFYVQVYIFSEFLEFLVEHIFSKPLAGKERMDLLKEFYCCFIWIKILFKSWYGSLLFVIFTPLVTYDIDIVRV